MDFFCMVVFTLLAVAQVHGSGTYPTSKRDIQQPQLNLPAAVLENSAVLSAREYITSAPQMSNSWIAAHTSAASESYVAASAAIAQSSIQASIMSAAAASQSKALEKQKEDADKEKFCINGKCHQNIGDHLRLGLTASLIGVCAVIMAVLLM